MSDNRDEVLEAALDRLDSTAPLTEQVVQFEELAETLQARLAEPQNPSPAE